MLRETVVPMEPGKPTRWRPKQLQSQETNFNFHEALSGAWSCSPDCSNCNTLMACEEGRGLTWEHVLREACLGSDQSLATPLLASWVNVTVHKNQLRRFDVFLKLRRPFAVWRKAKILWTQPQVPLLYCLY